MTQVIPAGCEAKCPGCKHRALPPTESARRKEDWLKKKLQPWADVIRTIRMPQEKVVEEEEEEQWNYRNSVCLHADWRNNRWAFGLLNDEEVIDIPDCPVHSKTVQRVVKYLAQALPPKEVFPLVYLSVTGSLVTFVLKNKLFPGSFEVSQIPWGSLGITGVFANLNPSAGRRVYFHRGWKHLWGEKCGQSDKMFYGPSSFQQLIPRLHRSALEEAKNYLHPSSEDGVIDLCSGLGSSLRLWKNLKAASIGVELNGEAVQFCNLNLNEDICLRGRCSERIPQFNKWIQRTKPKQLYVYANPSRLGLEKEITQWLSYVAKPKRIAYPSCSAGTLSRDLTLLSEGGYEVSQMIPYDFFPQTHHVETLVLLEANPTEMQNREKTT